MTAQAGGAIPSSQDVQVDFTTERNALRRELRRRRRAIPKSEQRSASLAIARLLSRHPMIRPGARVGVYLAMPGELDLQPFIDLAWQRNCRLFVPHITNARRKRMAFYPLFAASRLQMHRWGMPQLSDATRQKAYLGDRLDVALVPTLGFDATGNRLGMGGGFYDRHFSRLSRAGTYRRPYLIGVAYARQEVTRLESQSHDVPLKQIVTELGIQRVQRR